MEMSRLITIQGSARGGKGTLTRAFATHLQQNYSVQVIDQGLKFRVLARLALEAQIDIENLSHLEKFITRPSTHQEMLAMLTNAYTLTKDQLEAEFYTIAINNASGMCGKITATHDVVVSVLLDEVKELAQTHDFILIDGRALQKYAEQLANDGVVDYILAVDVVCSPMTAAKRMMGLASNAAIEDLTSDQKTQLLYLINDIDRRNSSDARRSRDPSLPIADAYIFDVLHERTKRELRDVAAEVAKTRTVMVDNSFTRTKEQLTAPCIELLDAIITS